MLDLAKKNLRKKIINCIDESNLELKAKLERLESSVEEAKVLARNAANTVSLLVNSDSYISTEYLLDSLSKTKRPKVLIFGYYGAKNLGDELMLQSILKRLDADKLDIAIMLDSNPDMDTSLYAPYRVLHYPTKSNDILYIAQNYDYIIWGGGAVIDDSDYQFEHLKNSLHYSLIKTSLAMIKLKKKVFVLGVSTNKALENKELLRDLQIIIDKASYFSLRDTNSLETLKNAGLDCSKIRIIDDLVIADLPKKTTKKVDNKDKVRIGFSFLMNEENLKKIDCFVDEVEAFFKEENPKKKIIINLIPFYDSKRADSDFVFFQKLKKFSQALIKDFPNNIDELADTFSGCDYIITMRYHGALISSTLGFKTLVVDCSNHHRHYYNKLNYINKHYCSFDWINFEDIDNSEKVKAELQKLVNQKSSFYNRDKIIDSENTLNEILKQVS